MTDDLGLATQKANLAHEALVKTMESGNVKEILAAIDAFDEAEKESEIETVKAGFLPAWPPKTDEGLARWNLTRDQVNDLLSRPRK